MGPREKLALRYVITSVVFLGFAGIEGLLMRFRLAGALSDWLTPDHFYSMIAIHPSVGIFGWAYIAVMGAFYYLVPNVLNKRLYSEKVANINYWMSAAGVLITWFSGFVLWFTGPYTLDWPLPIVRNPSMTVLVYSIGMFLIFFSVLVFFANMFATIFLPERGKSGARYVAKELLTVGFNLDKIRALSGGVKAYLPRVYNYPVFVVGVFRGCIDTTFNALVMAGIAVILALFSISSLIGFPLSTSLIDPLIFKNIFWWGLDLIADGNVLIFTSAVWFFLVPLLVGRKLYAEGWVRGVILADLVLSFFVWNHHLLADTPQPLALQIEGQIFTWGELISMGLAIFAVLMTIWLARPVKYSVPLKFTVLSVLGYAIGGSAGIIQANYALNRYLHNTQWVIGIHGHVQLLAGLSLTVFAVIYALAPMITGKELDSKLANIHLILWFAGVLIMTLAQGLAGIDGMLRRTLYFNGEYSGYMYAALTGGLLIAAGYLTFFYNYIKTYGLSSIVLAFKKEPPLPEVSARTL